MGYTFELSLLRCVVLCCAVCAGTRAGKRWYMVTDQRSGQDLIMTMVRDG